MPFRVRVPWHQPPRRALHAWPLRLGGGGQINGREKPCLAPCAGGSLSRHQMALIALFCTAHRRRARARTLAQPFAHPAGGCASGHGVTRRAVPGELRAALGVRLETRLLSEQGGAGDPGPPEGKVYNRWPPRAGAGVLLAAPDHGVGTRTCTAPRSASPVPGTHLCGHSLWALVPGARGVARSQGKATTSLLGCFSPITAPAKGSCSPQGWGRGAAAPIRGCPRDQPQPQGSAGSCWPRGGSIQLLPSTRQSWRISLTLP